MYGKLWSFMFTSCFDVHIFMPTSFFLYSWKRLFVLFYIYVWCTVQFCSGVLFRFALVYHFNLPRMGIWARFFQLNKLILTLSFCLALNLEGTCSGPLFVCKLICFYLFLYFVLFLFACLLVSLDCGIWSSNRHLKRSLIPATKRISTYNSNGVWTNWVGSLGHFISEHNIRAIRSLNITFVNMQCLLGIFYASYTTCLLI